jgi:hypothetical protein
MSSTARRILLAAACALAGRAAAAQDLTVYLESADAAPDTRVSVPMTLFFTAGQQAPIQALRATICLSEDVVRIDRVEPGTAGKAAGARVALAREAKRADGCAPTVVQVTFAKPPERGVIATLGVDIPKSAPVDRRIKVRAEYVATGASGEVKLAPSETEIAILAEMPAPIACFFYMH